MTISRFLREDYDPEELSKLERLERYWLFILVHGNQLGHKYDGITLDVTGKDFDNRPEVLALRNLERTGYVRIIQDENMYWSGTAGLELDHKGITLAAYDFDLRKLFR